MKLLIGLIAVVAIIYISSLDWKRAVKVALVIVVFEGALRKWFLPQASELIYFLKDFVLLGAYIKYYGCLTLEGKFVIKKNFINLVVFLAAGWCIFQAFNPSLGSPIIGLFGVKAYLFYTPLIWLIPDLFESEFELYKFLRTYLLLVIPVGLLGVVQFFSPANSVLNIYAPGQEAEGGIATFSSFARITGTFAYINNYTAYLLVSFALLIPLLSMKQSPRWMLVTIAEILFVFVNQIMSGSRAPVLGSVLFLSGYLGIKLFIQPYSALRFIKKFLPSAIVVGTVAFIGFQPALEAFLQRSSGNKDVSVRISASILEPLQFFQYKDVDGYGTGATQGGGMALRRMLGLPGGEQILVGFEAEMGRIALEIGPIGFVLWYLLRFSLMIGLLQVFFKLKTPFLKDLALAAFLIHAIQFIGQVVTLHTFAVYYWFLSSFIFLLPKLEQMNNFYRRAQLLQQDV